MARSIFDHNFFEALDTEEKAYWLGFIMADGCILETGKRKKQRTISIELALVDIRHLKKWHAAIKSTRSINKYDRLRKNKGVGKIFRSAVSNHSSIKMAADLLKYGCTPRKTLVLKFPLNIPNGLLNHFIRGYFDGDGSFYLDRRYKTPQLIANFVGTPNFINGIIGRLPVGSKAKHYKRGKVSTMFITGNINAINFGRWLYNNATIFLDRKKKLFDRHVEKYEAAKLRDDFGPFHKPGERNPNAKLTNKDVLKIKKMLYLGTHSQASIAKIFNADVMTISYIKRGIQWSSIIYNPEKE